MYKTDAQKLEEKLDKQYWYGYLTGCGVCLAVYVLVHFI